VSPDGSIETPRRQLPLVQLQQRLEVLERNDHVGGGLLDAIVNVRFASPTRRLTADGTASRISRNFATPVARSPGSASDRAVGHAGLRQEATQKRTSGVSGASAFSKLPILSVATLARHVGRQLERHEHGDTPNRPAG
jgi:hypothetical protein